MSLIDYLDPGRALLLEGKTKHAALSALTCAVCRDHPSLSADDVLARVEARERQLSTLVAPGIALPHARLPELAEMVIAVGLHASGLRWQTASEERAHLLVLVLGSDDEPREHIQALAGIARLLCHGANRQALLDAVDGRTLYEAYAAAEYATRRPTPTHRDRLTRQMLSHAAELAAGLPNAAVLIQDDGHLEAGWLEALCSRASRVLIADEGAGLRESQLPGVTLLHVPTQGLVADRRAELAVLLAVSQGLIDRRCTVVSVYGSGPHGGLDTLAVLDVAQSFGEVLALHGETMDANVDVQVLNRVLNIALSLASQGREGRSVGTIFVVGDHHCVVESANQIVINPFRGYPEDERNILDPSLEETVKEFSAIDGAFLIRGDGVILAAGACLPTDPEASRLPSGLGTRHIAGASITAHTKAISIVVSESTGSVTIFGGGKQMLVLERTGR